MNENTAVSVDAELGRRAAALRERFPAAAALLAEPALAAYATALTRVPDGWPYNRVAPAARQTRDALFAAGGLPLVAEVHRLMLLRGVAASRAALRQRPMLAEAAPFFESAAASIVADLERPDAEHRRYDLGADALLKDMAVVWLRAWPLGAQVVEPRLGVSRRYLFEGGIRTFVRGLGAFARAGGHAPLYEIHTYDRSLSEFTADGWLACYRRIARVMKADPPARGVFGSSWFFDPAIETVSPRLRYLRDIPLSGGATFVRVKPTAATVALATSKSETRRQLHAEGKYDPQQYLMVWPRGALLEWEARQG